MKRRPSFAAQILIFCLGLIWIIGSANAQKSEATKTVHQNTYQEKSDSAHLQDGPYVFWDGNRAIVQYICNGQKITRTWNVTNSIKIGSSCEDSSVTYEISADPPLPEADTFVGASRICAVGDIHGQFGQAITLLKGNKIIDDHLHWIWGDGHLVIIGDIFDRGDKVTEALWFVHQLEKEAQKKGGRVHYILGNHEVMVLRGDLRYTNKKYTQGTSRILKIRVWDLYGPETELGRWLRSKNVAVKVNRILFVHGGLSPDLQTRGYTIQMLNKAIRNSLDARDYTIRFDEELDFLYGYRGPFWYRGYIQDWYDIPMASEEQVKSLLAFYDADIVVVGHTIVEDITGYYGNRIFDIDTGIYRGSEGKVLMWENGVLYKADVNGKREILK